MPDDGSGKNDESDGGGSLVERAMRGAARRVRRSPEAAPGDTGRLSNVGQAAVETRSSTIVRDAERAVPADQSAIVPAIPVEGAEPGQSGAEQAGETSDEGVAFGAVPASRSRSRFVELDFDRLETMGFITPNRARTRTTEEFRLIKRTILQGITTARSEGRLNANLVMITSAGPSEGKTFNAINLAISIASEPDLNTLLVDADLVKPSVFETLGIEPGRGLIDIIESGDFNLADVLVRTNIDGMTLLGAGTPNPMATELIASERMRQFVDDVAQRYQDRIVIFDAPPLLATSEAAVLTEHMAQIVFVVEADRTSRNQAKEALDMIGAGPTVGLVLNKASARFGARQFGAYYKTYSKD